MLKYIILAIILSLFISCTSPETYMNRAIDIMSTNSINKDSIDWSKFRNEVLEKGKYAKSISETYPVIQYALMKLNDHHSFLMLPDQCKIYNDLYLPLPGILSELIENKIAYIKIPGFFGNRNKRADIFAKQIQTAIKELDKNNIRYWIIDLGENTGGNMWPILLGLGPVLGNGTAGYFVNSNNTFISWGYHDGTAFLGNRQIIKLDAPYKLKHGIKKIAILIGNHTGSSGEAIAISFIGVKNACLIGESTYGSSTGNQGLKISDGTMILLTVSKFADRNKKIYGVPVNPDIADSYLSSAKETAIEWINK